MKLAAEAEAGVRVANLAPGVLVNEVAVVGVLKVACLVGEGAEPVEGAGVVAKPSEPQAVRAKLSSPNKLTRHQILEIKAQANGSRPDIYFSFLA